MPCYDFRCPNGHSREIYAPITASLGAQGCGVCGQLMERVIHAPLLIKAAPAVCYDSPIDGRPITSRAARQEDLKRHDCHPYDPDAKTDHDRRRQQREAHLDQSIETFVEQKVEKMTTKERGTLYSELTEQGLVGETVRRTPHA